MTPAPQSMLTFDRVEVVYTGAILALHGVGLVVPQGRIIAVRRSSRADRTSLLKATSNVLPADRGRVTAARILFERQDVSRVSPADHVRAGLLQVLGGRH